MGECYHLDCQHNAQGYCGLLAHEECPKKASTSTYFLESWDELPSFRKLELSGEME